MIVTPDLIQYKGKIRVNNLYILSLLLRYSTLTKVFTLFYFVDLRSSIILNLLSIDDNNLRDDKIFIVVREFFSILLVRDTLGGFECTGMYVPVQFPHLIVFQETETRVTHWGR